MHIQISGLCRLVVKVWLAIPCLVPDGVEPVDAKSLGVTGKMFKPQLRERFSLPAVHSTWACSSQAVGRDVQREDLALPVVVATLSPRTVAVCQAATEQFLMAAGDEAPEALTRGRFTT